MALIKVGGIGQMTSKQDRITDAMKERIAQLERELSLCKHHLSEVVEQKETIECDVEALQKEAHDVVAQWVAKSSELQTKLDESVAQVVVVRNELLITKSSNDDLQRRLQDAHETNHVQAEELNQLKKASQDYAAKLARMEKDFSSASQQNIHYETLVSKMDLEMKQATEEMRALMQEKDVLIEVVAELREEKRSLEEARFEAKNFIGRLQNEVTDCERRLQQLLLIQSLDEEEFHAREEIVFQWGNFYLNALLAEAKENIHGNSLLQRKHQNLEAGINLLRKEKSLLETEVEKTSAELSALRQDYDKTTSNLSQHVRLLEQDITELQDSQISQKQIVDFLRKELDNSTAQIERYKSLNEDLNTEFKAVKDCYSSLLLEYNELRLSEERCQRETNAKITLLTDENKNIRADRDDRLQKLLKENTTLLERLSCTEREVLEHAELQARLILEVSKNNEWSTLLFYYASHLANWLQENDGQLRMMREEVDLKESFLKEKDEMNHTLC
ncbi:BRCT domain-containing protein, partial [Trypanosoma conorhini]